MALNYPEFVLAERAAQKTDYDILVDAINLKLCCDEETPKMPGCSMPYLERMVPDFVRAAKAQGLSDDQVLQQAVNIGLCSDEPISTGLGEENVGYIAPGSAEEIEAEFDPPLAGEAPGKGQPLNAKATDACEWPIPVLPDLTDIIGDLTDPSGGCLSGLVKPIQAIVEALASGLRSVCSCPDDSWISQLGYLANRQFNTQTYLGKFFYGALQTIVWVIRTGSCNTARISEYFSQATGCQGEALAAVAVAQIVVGVWKRWIGEVPEQLAEALARLGDFNCPTGIPNPAEANDLLASNFISEEAWTCFQRANGNIPKFQGPLVEARQRRPNDEELLRLQRAGLIDADTLVDLYSKNGWTNDEWWGWWQKAQLWVPSTTDAVEWMLKDTQDKQIQETFLLGAEFKQKYTGRVAEAFQQNGVTKGDAETIWRAHWRNVSPELLYHMHKRLRPGWTALMTDAEVASYVESICPIKNANVTPDVLAARPISNGFPVPTYCDELIGAAQMRAYLESIVVTGYHASEALGQDDYPAFWRPRMLALSYNVLTRVDARRAYEIGLFTDAKLVSVYMDQGYKESDAAALTAFAHRQLVLKFARSPTAKEWIAFPYQIGMLFDNLVADGMREDLWDEVYEILRLKVGVKKRIRQLKEARKQVLGGRIDKAAAIKKVAGVLGGA